MGGGGNGDAEDEARRSYELQKQQLELQKSQMAEMQRLEREKGLQQRSTYKSLLKMRSKGRASTMLTDWKTLGEPQVEKRFLHA